MDEPEYEPTVNEPGLTCYSSSLASENRRVGDTEIMPMGVGQLFFKYHWNVASILTLLYFGIFISYVDKSIIWSASEMKIRDQLLRLEMRRAICTVKQ